MARAVKVIGIFAVCACVLIAGPATAANFTAPVVTTGVANPVAATSATLNGTVNPEGAPTTYYFEYGTSTAYGSTAPAPPGSAGAGTAVVPVSAVIASLVPNTTYHYRLVATNASGAVNGSDQSFTTKPVPPGVATGGVSALTATSATLAGTVNPEGQATTYSFDYGPSTAYGSSAPAPPGSAGAGTAVVPVSAVIASLAPNTTYHYRLVATNASATVAGGDHTFKTKAATVASAPAATTGGVRALTATSATLTGTVNPKGQATIYDFQYGTSTAYGGNAPARAANAGAGTANVSAVAAVGSLAPSTLYHFRLVATNASGTTHGSDRSFRTKAASAVSISASPNPIVFGQMTTVHGLVLAPRAAHASVTLQASRSARGPFVTVARTTASATGGYAFARRALSRTTYLRALAVGLTSTPLFVPVQFRVTLSVSNKHPARGQRVRFRGRVAPGHRRMRVLVQRLGSNRRWHTVGRTRLHRSGKAWAYSVSLVPPRGGRYRAVAGPRSGDARGFSKTVRIHLR